MDYRRDSGEGRLIYLGLDHTGPRSSLFTTFKCYFVTQSISFSPYRLFFFCILTCGPNTQSVETFSESAHCAVVAMVWSCLATPVRMVILGRCSDCVRRGESVLRFPDRPLEFSPHGLGRTEAPAVLYG